MKKLLKTNFDLAIKITLNVITSEFPPTNDSYIFKSPKFLNKIEAERKKSPEEIKNKKLKTQTI